MNRFAGMLLCLEISLSGVTALKARLEAMKSILLLLLSKRVKAEWSAVVMGGPFDLSEVGQGTVAFEPCQLAPILLGLNL